MVQISFMSRAASTFKTGVGATTTYCQLLPGNAPEIATLATTTPYLQHGRAFINYNIATTTMGLNMKDEPHIYRVKVRNWKKKASGTYIALNREAGNNTAVITLSYVAVGELTRV